MPEITRHTVRVTTGYREIALWIVWRLCAPPVWVSRATGALVGPSLTIMVGRLSTAACIMAGYLSTAAYVMADNARHRVAGLRLRPSAPYIFVMATVVVLALFSGLIGHA